MNVLADFRLSPYLSRHGEYVLLTSSDTFPDQFRSHDRNRHDLLCAGGRQASRKRPEQLIPDGLKPEDHLEVALSEWHPYSFPAKSTDAICFASSWAAHVDGDLCAARKQVCFALKELADSVEHDKSMLLGLMQEPVQDVLKCYGVKNQPFMREVAAVCNPSDREAICDLAIGLPLIGWTRPADGMMTRLRPPVSDRSEWKETSVERNAKLLLKCTSSGDAALDKESFKKSMAEVKAGCLLGPFESLEAVPFQEPSLAPRHGIWELHGEAVQPTVRNIDDLLAGGQNSSWNGVIP